VSGAPAVKLASAGKPLPLAARAPIENSFQADMSHVRVHDDTTSNKAADSMHARAFTYGSHIYLGSKEHSGDISLMAHEAAHVVQQQQAPAVQMFPASPTTSSHEAEARHAATAAMAGQTYNVQNRTGSSTIQLQEEESYLESFRSAASERLSSVTESARETAEQGVEYVGETAERGLDWARERAWSLVERYAPRLVPILREGPAGVANWIGDKVVAGFENLFDTLTAPLQAVSSFLGPVQSRFSNALTWMRTAAAQIASGDCSALSQAAQMISDVFDTIAGPYIERLREFAESTQEFFSGIWEKLSAGARQLWDALSEFAGQAWTEIQNFVSWVWDKTAPIRNMILGPLGSVWGWIKEKLGIRQQVSERGGIWEWVKNEVGDAWEGLKARVEPFKDKIYVTLGVVAGVLVLLSPAGPFVALAGLITGAMVGIRWIRQNFSNPNNLVQQRGVLEGQIIPTLMNAVNAISDKVSEAANGLAERLRSILTKMGGMARLIGGTFLSFAVSFVNWLVEHFQALVQWATEQLVSLANWVKRGLERLREFLAPVRAFLRQVGVMLLDLFRVVEFIGGRIWNAIPACIRDPFVNFLVNQILARLPFFGEIVTIPDIWQQIRESARSFIQRVFINGDLMAALTAIFRLILRVLNVPVELITQIFQRADQLIDQLARNPMGFLRNMLAALRQGFSLFFNNILTHLMNGALNWLFSQVSQIGIQRPPDFSLRSIFGLVMQILGLSVDFVWQRLAQRIGQERAQQLRNIVDQVTGALVWLRDLVTEGPGALWQHIQEQLGNLQAMVINAVSGWIMSTVVGRAMARLATMLDPSGIMLVVQSVISIYRGLQTLIQQAAEILGVINAFLGSLVNIGRGVIGDAASAIAGAMGRAISPMIAFLANQAGLGRVGRRIREAVMSIRERVTRAIDWLIDRVVRGGQFLLNLGRRAAGAVRNWWEQRRSFTAPDGDRHSLFFEGQGRNAQLMVASDEQTFTSLVNELNLPPDDRQAMTARNEALRIIRDIDGIRNQNNITDQQAQRLNSLLDALVPYASRLMVFAASRATGQYIYQGTSLSSNNREVGIQSDLKVFELNPNRELTGEQRQAVLQRAVETLEARVPMHYPTDGLGRASGPQGHVTDVKQNEERENLPAHSQLPGGAAAYLPGDERGHLIGDRFHGVANGSNLVPQAFVLNHSTFYRYELNLGNEYLAHRDNGVLLYMFVQPTYPGNTPISANYRPTSIRGDARIVTLEPNQTKLRRHVIGRSGGPFSNPPPDLRVVDLNNADEATIASAIGQLATNRFLVDAILQAREVAGGKFADELHFVWDLAMTIGDSRRVARAEDVLKRRMQVITFIFG
jgi:xanthosine utilization system XapX-like protein